MAEKNTTLKDLIRDIDFRLTHLEDMEYDNRKLMVKLVKQGNTIVKFLQQLEVTDPEPMEDEIFMERKDLIGKDKIRSVKELIDEYMDKHEELKEFEEELEKHKDKITPGKIGEA